MDSLSENELCHLWKLVLGHVPGNLTEFRDTLKRMVTLGNATVTVTRHRVDVDLPMLHVGFTR